MKESAIDSEQQQLALYNNKSKADKNLVTAPDGKSKPAEVDDDAGPITSECDPEGKPTTRHSTASADSGTQSHEPIIMGNTGSVSTASLDSGDKNDAVPKTRIERVRQALRIQSIRKKPGKEGLEKKKSKEEKANNNNNNGMQTDKHALNGTYYSESVSRSATLPSDVNKINRINGDRSLSVNMRDNSTIQARLLPAYKSEQRVGIIGNIQQRQRMMSSPSYIPSTRQRTNSQSSTYSHRYNNFRRVTTTHIPDHIDKKLVRSRSVGVIADAELRMRKTTSASVVKLADCEDWVV